MLVNNPLDLIGNTPLVLLTKLSSHYNCNIYLKLEKYNLTYSSKDRIVKNILLNAIKNNKINKDTTIVEATSGNTGISLACICSLLSLKCIIVMPENASEERKKMISAYGAKLVFTDKNDKMKGCIKKVKEIIKENKNTYVLSQFDSLDNMDSHFKYTAKEIYDDLKSIDCFFCSYGTGGTISGVSKYLKQKNNNIKCIGVIPNSKQHKIEGVYSNVKSKNLNKKLIDRIIKIDDVDVFKMQQYLSKHEGLFLGLSSALTICGAINEIKKQTYKNVVIFCPDGAERYLSNDLLIKRQFSKEEIINDFQHMYNRLFVDDNVGYDDVYIKYNITKKALKTIYKKLELDAISIYENDPACDSIKQVKETYLSFYAIVAYRIANYIYLNYDKRIARIISEHAHYKSAIDIHPSAKIGKSFCIDHGTGIVIGQTSVIKDNVKIYHGVTLGALSLKNKRKLINVKRHPTILNNVTIYCNASIFGGKTIIGNNCIIGANQTITSSLKDNTVVKDKK